MLTQACIKDSVWRFNVQVDSLVLCLSLSRKIYFYWFGSVIFHPQGFTSKKKKKKKKVKKKKRKKKKKKKKKGKRRRRKRKKQLHHLRSCKGISMQFGGLTSKDLFVIFYLMLVHFFGPTLLSTDNDSDFF